MSNSQEEQSSFFDEMSDVRPIKQDKINAHCAARSLKDKHKNAEKLSKVTVKNVPLSHLSIKDIDGDDFICFQQPGVQDGVFKNLRLGKYSIDNTLNLSGLTLDQAAVALYQTVQDCHHKGLRALLIRHGKGKKKSYVNHWLPQISEIIAYHTAQPVHGGLGATYLLLKKHPEQKLINRERNRRR